MLDTDIAAAIYSGLNRKQHDVIMHLNAENEILFLHPLERECSKKRGKWLTGFKGVLVRRHSFGLLHGLCG